MMIKLKKLLKESKYAWDRKFGDPLPTFKDIAETHQNKPKEPIKESKLPKFIVPGDVSYYDKHWGDTFDELGNHRAIDYGPRESDMYDWNGRANYQAATKEFHTHMSKIANKLNSVVGELEGSYKVWNKILKKHRNNDRR
jgi:hypothetical protein